MRDSEVFVSCFEFEFLFRVCRRIFDSNFEFKFLEFSCRISNSSFSFRYSIRFLESDFEFVVEFDFSNVVSNFKFECVVEISRRNFRFVTLFDFSNLTLNSSSNSTSRMSCRISNSNASSKFLVEIFVSLLYSTSRISLLYSISRISIFDSNFDSSFECKFLDFRVEFRIRLFRFVALFDFSKSIVKFDFSNFEFSIRLLDSSPLNLMIRNCRRISNSSFFIVLIYSTSRTSIRICRRNCRFRVAFFI